MNVIYKLINELLSADKLGKQRVATNKLAKGIEHYANQRVIEELHNLYNEEEEHDDCISKELIYQRLKELKQE